MLVWVKNSVGKQELVELARGRSGVKRYYACIYVPFVVRRSERYMISIKFGSQGKYVGHTDLVTGDFASVIGLKLKGPFFSSPPLVTLPALSKDIELYSELGLAGLNGNALFPEFTLTVAYLPAAKFSSMGDSALGSKVDFVGETSSPTPSNPSPARSGLSSRGSSGGGVGVRGGSGIGRVLAIVWVLRAAFDSLHDDIDTSVKIAYDLKRRRTLDSL